jgi:esterase
MSEVQTSGIRIYYEEHGQGPAILLIHGSGSDATFWGGAIDDLAQFGRIITYDRRGCSRTQRPDPYVTTSPDEQAEDAAGLLRALGAAPAIVIGRSLGGLVALELARRHPGLVRALVLLEAAPSGLSPEADAVMDGLGAKLREVATARGVGAVGETLIRTVLHDTGWEALPQAAKDRLSANGAAILAEFNMHQPEIENPSVLGTITQPVLLIAAEGSPPMFRRISDQLVRHIPHAQLVLAGGGHLISPAQPPVLSFLQQLLRSEQPAQYPA